MNSFSTSDDTKEHLQKKHGELIAEEDSELVQNKSPKVDAKTLKPAEHPANRDQEWCVPVAGSHAASSELRPPADAHQTACRIGGCEAPSNPALA